MVIPLPGLPPMRINSSSSKKNGNGKVTTEGDSTGAFPQLEE